MRTSHTFTDHFPDSTIQSDTNIYASDENADFRNTNSSIQPDTHRDH